jgi:hypothetical protein
MSGLLDDLSGKRGELWKGEAERILIKFYDTIIDNQGVIRWKDNSSVPSKDLLEVWHFAGMNFDFEKAIEVGSNEIAKQFTAYQERMRNYKYSEDEMEAMRASIMM